LQSLVEVAIRREDGEGTTRRKPRVSCRVSFQPVKLHFLDSPKLTDTCRYQNCESGIEDRRFHGFPEEGGEKGGDGLGGEDWEVKVNGRRRSFF